MNFYLVFYDDDGSREACSVFYSWLVQAKSMEEAINKVARLQEDEDHLSAFQWVANADNKKIWEQKENDEDEDEE